MPSPVRKKSTTTSETKETLRKQTNELPLFRGELPLDERRTAGKALRTKVPREAHGSWSRHRDHPGAVEIVMATNKGRQPHLIPLRMARMAASPFAFYRGAAAVMAHDLSKTPSTGIHVVIDGDAHLNNFGFYGTPQRDVVFDLNDFDETTIGPWEWDLKRLTASVNLAARENGMNRFERDMAVKRCARGYRFNMNRLQTMGVLETWYLHAYPGRENPLVKVDAKSRAVFSKVLAKANQQTNAALLSKMATREKDGHWTFREDPPVLTHVDAKTHKVVEEALMEYAHTLPRERQLMLTRYRVVAVAHRVVGVGSVGTRAYLVLLLGNGDNDPLFLQVKEAIVPVHAAFVPALPREETVHQGRRVVTGQHVLQASTDVMLGWTQIGSVPYYVRQMKNLKASIPIEWLTGSSFNFYAWACGAILARAHARVAGVAQIAAYCGKSATLDEALAKWAEAYGNQTELDHAALVRAVKDDRQVQAMMGK
ncbi:DUF2252 domain-containing protein [Terracidiphilus gabretensis]|uniref:DUF2252 domain-containing protein n=1 Tax=Terracidiphilus gabretensis TaxID=1577687 RepID=UPI001E630AD2|nr:DUF2252 domain-containing protein [Terracidiphilus gabretensis]